MMMIVTSICFIPATVSVRLGIPEPAE